MSLFVYPQVADLPRSPRRPLLGLMVGAVLAPVVAWAQGPGVFRIGVTKIVSHAALDGVERGVEAGMATAEAIATPTAQAVMCSGSRIALVFPSVTDPVRAGLVPASSAQSQKTLSHFTGLSDLWPVHLQFETCVRAVQQAKIWSTIYNPGEVNPLSHIHMMREAAKSLGLTLFHGLRIGLLLGAYSAGRKATLVLKGIKPGDVPWGPVEKFSLVINTRAAQAQGVVLAPELLARADKVIR